ncbi:MAG TPA: ROK family transcriptional regulator [Pyrinomonadaceae bacterium]|nr:ROK family transcriptional regulator [Pyrinomonadaceae bacterium]
MKREDLKKRTLKGFTSTGSQGSLRQQNISSILRLIYSNRPISRVELSRMTGLNKATVSSLVADLIENRLIRFVGENKQERAGRREVMIDIEPRAGAIVSAEVGVGFISVVAANFAGGIFCRKGAEVDRNESPEKIVAQLVRLLNAAARESESTYGRIKGVSVAVPGAVDAETGNVLFAPNLGWRNFDLLSRVESDFDAPVHIDNEASLAAMGEHFFGAAKGLNEVVYISVGIGIGGGVIVNGDLYRGAGGIAGEFGHMTVDVNGQKCSCGKIGCWETIAGESTLLKAFGANSGSTDIGWIRSDAEKLNRLLEAARRNNAKAHKVLAKTAANLAVGIDSLIKAFDPEVVVLGGPVGVLKEFLIPLVEAELEKRRIFDVTHKVAVVSASFGREAALMGGVAKIVRSILARPLQ